MEVMGLASRSDMARELINQLLCQQDTGVYGTSRRGEGTYCIDTFETV